MSNARELSSISRLYYREVEIIKADKDSPCLVKTSYNTISIKAGTLVMLDSGVITFKTQTAVTMPALSVGGDYSIWVHPDGSASCVVDSFITPASAPVVGAKKIGGFHNGLIAAGTTVASGGFSTSGVTADGGSMAWTQADVDKLIGINEFSIWDLDWHAAGEQYGMAFEPISKVWWGIYFMSDSPHINGMSRYNTNIASGTVLPFIPAEMGGNGVLKYSRLSTFEANEILRVHGHRMPLYEEFMLAAFGVTEAISLGGAEVTVPATTRQNGFTSRIGLEQATGHQWILGGPIHSVGGSGWSNVGRGDIYATSGEILLGGARTNSSNSGSRCSYFNTTLSNSHWNISVRSSSDHVAGTRKCS